MPAVPRIALSGDDSIPQIGFGVYRIPDTEVAEAVTTAIELGYRSIDTASVYGNERGVGEAVRASGVARRDLFITTKLQRQTMGREAAAREFDTSLQQLGLDYVDLYLIHWPVPSLDLFVETWEALQEIHAGGRARNVGVSNFQIPHLERLRLETGVIPAINQVEVHPYLPQGDLRAYHKEHGIVTEAWSPLAKGGDLLGEQLIQDIAGKHGKSPAQVVLRWHVQLGNVIIPKSVNARRMAENLDILDFELSTQDFADIATLNSGLRTGPHPDHM
jgi:2,5-diketo-D-gluconate reductase A